jgi:hypothetical protein
MTFQYPEHFKYPENKRIFFLDHILTWENILSPFKDRPNVCLEIGSLHGGSSATPPGKWPGTALPGLLGPGPPVVTHCHCTFAGPARGGSSGAPTPAPASSFDP